MDVSGGVMGPCFLQLIIMNHDDDRIASFETLVEKSVPQSYLWTNILLSTSGENCFIGDFYYIYCVTKEVRHKKINDI
jgi:hypothetical protein